MKTFKEFLKEGGNLKIGNISVSPIKMTSENRSTISNDVHDSLSALHDSMQKEHGIELFGKNKKALITRTAYSGSTEHLMNPDISSEEFSKHKPLVGDIDVKIPKEHFDLLHKHLVPGTKHGKYTVVGVKKGGGELHAILKHDNGEHHQIDFEKSTYSNNEPSKFDTFAHSSDWEDNKNKIKGVHHKQLLNAVGLDHHKFSILYGIKSRSNEDEPWESDTKKMTSTLFGKKADSNQLHSFHGITQLIKKHIPKEHHQLIYDKFKTDSSRSKGIDNSFALNHLKKHLNVND